MVTPFEKALADFKDATQALGAAWDPIDGDIFGNTYPKYLPSFDQFADDVRAMYAQPKERAFIVTNREQHRVMAPSAEAAREKFDNDGGEYLTTLETTVEEASCESTT